MTAGFQPLTNFQPNPDWASLPLFDRTGWRCMAFGDFAESIGERAEPKDAQEEIYVGLEHLDSQCLHIRRWGKGSDVTGTKLRFRKGDIIFGRRRAYQRKLAVAEFDGICSAHALVVRAKPKIVLPEFLPFLMMSDRFMNRAVEISVGSLSPTINWTTLKLETFDLPPLDLQRRIAEILWAVDSCRMAWGSVRIQMLQYKAILSDELLVRGTVREQLCDSSIGRIPHSWKVERLKDVCEHVSVGIASAATHAYAEEGTPLIRNQNIKEGFLDTTELLFITPEFDDEYAGKRLKEGDVLTVRTGYPGVSAVVPKQYESCQSFTTLISRPIKERLNPHFLCHWINSKHGKAFVAVGKMGAAQQNLNAGILEDMELPIPPLNEQDDICEAISCSAESLNEIESHLKSLDKLHARLLSGLIER